MIPKNTAFLLKNAAKQQCIGINMAGLVPAGKRKTAREKSRHIRSDASRSRRATKRQAGTEAAGARESPPLRPATAQPGQRRSCEAEVGQMQVKTWVLRVRAHQKPHGSGCVVTLLNRITFCTELVRKGPSAVGALG